MDLPRCQSGPTVRAVLPVLVRPSPTPPLPALAARHQGAHRGFGGATLGVARGYGPALGRARPQHVRVAVGRTTSGGPTSRCRSSRPCTWCTAGVGGRGAGGPARTREAEAAVCRRWRRRRRRRGGAPAVLLPRGGGSPRAGIATGPGPSAIAAGGLSSRLAATGRS